MLLRTVFTSACLGLAALPSAAISQDSVTKMDTSLLEGVGSFGTRPMGVLSLRPPSLSGAIENNPALGFSESTAQQHSTSRARRGSLKDRIRIELQDTAIYGVFSGGEQPGATDGVVGVGVERPLDRGLALNLELYQHTSKARRTGNAQDDTKATLKLLFRF